MLRMCLPGNGCGRWVRKRSNPAAKTTAGRGPGKHPRFRVPEKFRHAIRRACHCGREPRGTAFGENRGEQPNQISYSRNLGQRGPSPVRCRQTMALSTRVPHPPDPVARLLPTPESRSQACKHALPRRDRASLGRLAYPRHPQPILPDAKAVRRCHITLLARNHPQNGRAFVTKSPTTSASYRTRTFGFCSEASITAIYRRSVCAAPARSIAAPLRRISSPPKFWAIRQEMGNQAEHF
jgi:hypothetical protein